MNLQINFPEEFPNLIGEKIQLSSFGPEDVDGYFNMRSDVEFMKYLGMDPMKKKSEARDRVSSMIESFKRGEGLSWKISEKDSDEVIGYIGFWRIDFKHYRGELGFGLHADYRRRGYMLEALELAIDYGFQSMNFHSMMADVDPRNVPSVKLLNKVGFREEGHLRENYFYNGEFFDSVYFGLLKSDI